MLPLFCILLSPICLLSQQKWTIDVSRGLSIPTGAFKRVESAEVGRTSSINMAYRFSKYIGIGLSLGYTANDMDTEQLENRLSSGIGTVVSTEQEGGYIALHAQLGPQFGYFSDVFSVGLMPQVGYQHVFSNIPDFTFPEENIDLDITENNYGALVYGVGLSASLRTAEVLEIGCRLNYFYADHDSSLQATGRSETIFFTESFPGQLNYRSLQMMLLIGVSF